jgi:hypothetical protein
METPIYLNSQIDKILTQVFDGVSKPVQLHLSTKPTFYLALEKGTREGHVVCTYLQTCFTLHFFVAILELLCKLSAFVNPVKTGFCRIKKLPNHQGVFGEICKQ